MELAELEQVRPFLLALLGVQGSGRDRPDGNVPREEQGPDPKYTYPPPRPRERGILNPRPRQMFIPVDPEYQPKEEDLRHPTQVNLMRHAFALAPDNDLYYPLLYQVRNATYRWFFNECSGEGLEEAGRKAQMRLDQDLPEVADLIRRHKPRSPQLRPLYIGRALRWIEVQLPFQGLDAEGLIRILNRESGLDSRKGEVDRVAAVGNGNVVVADPENKGGQHDRGVQSINLAIKPSMHEKLTCQGARTPSPVENDRGVGSLELKPHEAHLLAMSLQKFSPEGRARLGFRTKNGFGLEDIIKSTEPAETTQDGLSGSLDLRDLYLKLVAIASNSPQARRDNASKPEVAALVEMLAGVLPGNIEKLLSKGLPR